MRIRVDCVCNNLGMYHLGGKSNDIVVRSDLCKPNFNISSLIGGPYSCAASSGGGISLGFGKQKTQFGVSTTPAQNGTDLA